MNLDQDSSECEQCLGVFGKYWQPGKVKTRLAKGIGERRASLVYLAFLRTILHRFASSADQRILAYWPSDRLSEFSDLVGERWKLIPQVDEYHHPSQNLGQRMKYFFDSRFHHGARRVVLIGSDSPTLPTALVERAFEALLEKQVVIGPAEDGGYYLIGMSRFEPKIFDDIPWSTEHVFERTIASIRQSSLSCHILQQWNDVDDLEDLLRLRRQLQTASSLDESCSKLLAEIDGLLSELPL